MPAPEAVAAMVPYYNEFWANPSSAHRFGQRARQGVDHARQQVANLVGAEASELLFTGGGTESVNTAVRSLLASRAPRRKIITSTVEHSATRELLISLEGEGYEIVRIEVSRQGELDLGPTDHGRGRRDGLVHDDVGEQRDGDDLPHRADRRDLCELPRADAHRCHAGGRQAADGPARGRDRGGELCVAQVSRSQGRGGRCTFAVGLGCARC